MSNINPGHVRAFQAIRSQLYDNITLMSCTINGEAGVAIVLMEHVGENKIGVMPLFVAITEGMDIDFPTDQSSDEGGGGPKNPKEDFEANKTATTAPQKPTLG
jgi:hypothetical protein